MKISKHTNKKRILTTSLKHKKRKKMRKRSPSTSSTSSSSSSTSSDSNSSCSSSSSSSRSNSSSCSSSSNDGSRKHKSKVVTQKVKSILKSKHKKNVSKTKKVEDENDALTDVPIDLMERAKTMAPMTKEQWEKQQSVIKKVYDKSTGRHRLIKGDGEIIEEIVSKERHKNINKMATKGDGDYFQHNMSSGSIK